MKIILAKVKKHFSQNLPFVLYKKPNVVDIVAILQRNDTLFTVNNYTERGFVFASFDGTKTFIIPEEESVVERANFEHLDIVVQEKVTTYLDGVSKVNFEQLVTKGIQAITKNEFKKVVLSRKETLNLNQFDILVAFEKLVQLYPTTFVYCFFHPKIGLWLGATPEQLVKYNNTTFETIALAGTQKDFGSNEVHWPTKEQEEQQYVTDYIVHKCSNIASEIKLSKPYNIKAGKVWHIKTDISVRLRFGYGLKEIIKLLHPTPAVCGLPMRESKQFILENESYDRTFYTGFLGELNIENASDLFVNLRCMNIEGLQAHLFMGCGITEKSNPQKEWEESNNKSETMKKILDFYYQKL